MTIISILAGLLLPALKRARDMARKTTCASQIRQTGLAIVQYADDYRGYLLPHWSNSESMFTLPGNANYYCAGFAVLVTEQYLTTGATLLCPSDKKRGFKGLPKYSRDAGNYMINNSMVWASYDLQAWGRSVDFPGIVSKAVYHSSRGPQQNNIRKAPYAYVSDFFSRRYLYPTHVRAHEHGYNVWFTDSHVAFVRDRGADPLDPAYPTYPAFGYSPAGMSNGMQPWRYFEDPEYMP